MKLITSEAVSIGHPDKVADQISDAMLDECLKQDSNSRVAVETMVTTNTVFLAGEVTTHADVDVDSLVRGVVKDIGYDFNGFDYNNLTISRHIHRQSPDIEMGVDRDGAGDQGMMFGYAEGDASTNYLPVPICYAQALMLEFQRRRQYTDNWAMENLRPDAKCQITYDEDSGKIRTIVISHQHVDSMYFGHFINHARMAIRRVIPENLILPLEFLNHDDEYSLLEDKTFVFLNPTGRFVEGGPSADTGLTGRKIVVDTYGGVGKVGGGCVDKETEFLTPTGWKKIIDFNQNDLVAQWEEGKMSFTNGEFVKLPKTRMYYVHSPQTIDMVLSDNHNFLYRTSKGHYHKIPFQQVVDAYHSNKNGYRSEMPIFFNYDFADSKGVSLSDDEIRLQTAFCADGTILDEKKWYGRISIKKQYKKDRLEMLLNNCKYEYKKSPSNDYDIYYFNPPLKSKLLSDCFQDINLHQAEILAEEVLQWDGDRKNCFRTTKKEDADFIQFIFMSLTGKTSKIVVDDRIGEKTNLGKYTRKSICYTVYQGKLKFCSAFRKNQKYHSRIEISDYEDGDEFMYCINVPSHNLVLRRNNRVFITGNCFSGKDPSKVDRSAAYMCRYVAKNLVASGKCRKAEVSVAYAIGVAEPVQVSVNTFGTGNDAELTEYVRQKYDFKPKAIIERFGLRNPQGWCYRDTARNGHFTNCSFPWEEIEK